MAVCVQVLVGNKKFLVPFEYGKKRDMSASSFSYLCDKEDVGKGVEKII